MTIMESKQWYKSKTFWVMAVGELIALLEIFAGLDIPYVNAEAIAIGIPILGFVLRLLTYKPITGSTADKIRLPKRHHWLILLPLVGLLLSCGTVDKILEPKPTEEQTIRAEYDALSVEYHAMGNTIYLRRQDGFVTDAQWKTFEKIQREQAAIAEDALQLLDYWQEWNKKPERIDGVMDDLRDQISSLRALVAETSTRQGTV